MRTISIILVLTTGCAHHDIVRDNRESSDLREHFKRAGFEANVHRNNSPLPGGAILHWKLDVPKAPDRGLAFGMTSDVYRFMYPSAADDYAQAIEGGRSVTTVSGIYVLVTSRSFGLGHHDEGHGDPRTPGLKEAHETYAKLWAQYQKGESKEVFQKALEALRAEKPLAKKEVASCRAELTAIFQLFAQSSSLRLRRVRSPSHSRIRQYSLKQQYIRRIL